MQQGPLHLPAALLRNLVRIEGEVAVDRYRRAQEAFGQTPTELSVFHVDAAGYSPEIAAECDDPLYLCPSPLRAHALLISDRQLSARVVHPGFGPAAATYSELLTRFGTELSQLTLQEAILAETHPRGASPARTTDLAAVQHFEIEFRSPSGRLRDRQRLDEEKRAFLESDRLWLDDSAIAQMIALARRVGEIAGLPADLLSSSHAIDLFYSPAFPAPSPFSETYILRERGARKVVTYVLTKKPETTPESLDLEPRSLEPADVVETLQGLGIARFEPGRHQREPEHIDRALYWLALDYLYDRESVPESLDRRSIELAMRSEEAPESFRELAEVARAIRAREAVKASELSPQTVLRLLLPSSTRPTVQRFVRHLLAGLDACRLDSQWLDAPDLFFSRLPTLARDRIQLLARWLESEAQRTRKVNAPARRSE